MSLRALRFLLLSLALFGLAWCGLSSMARAGVASFTDRGKTDFDTLLQLLNPYGRWTKIGGKWAFTPTDHQAPYTDGRWIYTEYGWYWKGRFPHSWATEHYGYWKRSADQVWSWYPGPYWLPQIVEIRASNKYLGWRTSEVDDNGNFVDAPIDRYSKPDEWTFVTLEQFANPITPAIVAPPDIARTQLEVSTDCRHTYLTYREIDRPGPHPADFADLCHDGGMLAPAIFHEGATPTPPAPTPAPATPTNAPNNRVAVMTGTNAPALLGTEIDPSADTRKVNYWITMSLPSFWTPPPTDAKANEIYLYRPAIFQDQDGIERRISLWFNPKERTTLTELLNKPKPAARTEASSTAPGVAAVPVTPPAPEPAPSHNPFSSPLDAPFQPGASTATNHPPNASSKNPVPSGLSSEAPIPLPITNAAPSTRN